MLHVRVIAPQDEAERALRLFESSRGATNVVYHPGYGRQPLGDLVAADVAHEDASLLIADLRELGIEREGAITVIPVDVALSRGITTMKSRQHDAGGSVVWEEVAARSSEWTELDGEYMVFMAMAGIIAAVGLLTDSVVLIIGAMIVGPDFGPMAGACVALTTRRLGLARRSLEALVARLAVAAVSAWVLTAVCRATDLVPRSRGASFLTDFVSRPNWWSIIVALAAGVVGILSLTTWKSSAIVGVLVSVTTIPAIANAGVSAARTAE